MEAFQKHVNLFSPKGTVFRAFADQVIFFLKFLILTLKFWGRIGQAGNRS